MSKARIKETLKNLDYKSFLDLLSNIGLSEIKRTIMIKHYMYDTPLNIVCGEVGLSQQSTYKYHKEILIKINKYLSKNTAKN